MNANLIAAISPQNPLRTSPNTHALRRPRRCRVGARVLCRRRPARAAFQLVHAAISAASRQSVAGAAREDANFEVVRPRVREAVRVLFWCGVLRPVSHHGLVCTMRDGVRRCAAPELAGVAVISCAVVAVCPDQVLRPMPVHQRHLCCFLPVRRQLECGWVCCERQRPGHRVVPWHNPFKPAGQRVFLA